MNTNTKLGRPYLTIKYPRGFFTVKDLYSLNRGDAKDSTLCMLTIRNHVNKQLKAGFLSEGTPLKTGKRGQPEHRFIRTSVKSGIDARVNRPSSIPNPTEGVALTEAEIAAQSVS